MKYVVNVSGGLTSFWALKRTVEQFGVSNTVAVFADTKIEDPTLYAFLDDQERLLGITIHRLADGRTPFQVWIDEHAIVVKGVALCSNILKREVIQKWMRRNSIKWDFYTIVLGMEWREIARMDRMRKLYYPTPVWFPLAEKPYIEKDDIISYLESININVPKLYYEGFEHNNCGGGCVRAGKAHWAHLWRTRLATYIIWEVQEQIFIESLESSGLPKRTILSERVGGKLNLVTLREFRDRLERNESYDQHDWGACGCFLAGHTDSSG